MNTTDTHDLIVNAIWNAANGRPIPFNPDDLATAVLPITAAEVRKAKAEALREAAGDIVWSAEVLPHMTPHDAARGLVRRADRIETGDQR